MCIHLRAQLSRHKFCLPDASVREIALAPALRSHDARFGTRPDTATAQAAQTRTGAIRRRQAEWERRPFEA